VRGPLDEEELRNWEPQAAEFIVKSIRGNKGIGVKKYSRADLLKFWQHTSQSFDQRYIIQPFLKDATEVRHLILGDDHFFIQKNRPKDPNEFRKNSAFSEFTQSSLKESELNQLKEQGKLMQQKLGCRSFAIDLMYEESSWKVLEMNANPGLSQASKVFPEENLFKKYLNSFISS
jgi:glutathione synthase/RimK-type ligase-like ATP-grasp enzyme